MQADSENQHIGWIWKQPAGCILKTTYRLHLENNQEAVSWKQPRGCILKSKCTWFEDTPYNPPICGVARLTAITIQATRLYAFVLWPAARAIATTSVDQRVSESICAQWQQGYPSDMDEDAQVERMKFEIPTLRTGLTLYTARYKKSSWENI